MVNWRERYLNERRSQMFGTSLYNRPRSKNISPAKIFYAKLKASKKFIQLRGYTDWSWSMNADGSNYRRYYRDKKYRRHDSCWYVYQGEGNRRAIIEMPEWNGYNSRVFLKILWVPRSLQKQGIATECMTELMGMTDDVDAMAKSGERYEDNNITGGSFVLTLIPNSFVIREDYWDIEKIAKRKDCLDWTCSPNSKADNVPDAKMFDEINSLLPEDEVRMTQKDLEQFYIDKLGFVKCEELAIHESFNWETGHVNRQLTITGRSVTLERFPLLYPAKNLKYWEKEEEG